jgi:RHS repeat-associated protein
LPGQYYDAETGLHHNIRRQYDPRTGRYLTPDPLSQTAGMNLAQIEGASGANAYVYSGSDPINHFDAQGLYQEDIHYYMTFFLALVAGVSYDDAKIIALADQYIDNNPDTWPLDETGGLIKTAESYVGDISGAVKRLQTYHFTQYGFDPSPMVYHPTPEERAAAIAAGYPDPGPTTYEDPTLYAERRIKNPSNPQLTQLLSASNKAPTTCAQLQFFGEYLHAFEDTFGHRDQNNAPIEVNMGLGHALYGSQPDYTYNAWVLIGLPGEIGDWDTRESRTLEMEHELFDKLSSSKFATLPAKASFASLTDFLKEFNQTPENHDTGFDKKLALLDGELKALGVTRPDGKLVDFKNPIEKGGEGYPIAGAPVAAIDNRNAFLCDAAGHRLNQSDFPGTILPKATVPCK